MTKERPINRWIVLGVLTVFGMFTGMTVWYGFTSYFGPLIEEFGWSYTEVSVGGAVSAAETGIGALFIGFLVDRFGGRKVILVGTVIFTAGFMLLSRVNSLPEFYVYYAMLGLGSTVCGVPVALPILSRLFKDRIAAPFALFTIGIASGGLVLPIVVMMLDSLGFRTTFVVFGCIALFLGLSAVSILGQFHKSTETRSISSSPSETVLQEDSTSESTGMTVREFWFQNVFPSRAFWSLLALFMAHVFVVQMVMTHIMPFLESIGYSRDLASRVAMVVPGISILGRLGFGWIGERFSRLYVIIGVMLIQATGVLVIASVGSGPLIIPSLVLYGIGYGATAPGRPALLHDYFKGQHFGSVLGVVLGVSVLTGIAGPIIGGWLFDTSGSYNSSFWIATGMLVLGTFPLLSLRKTPTANSL